MELRDVEAFLAVADELHFRRAAARLGVSQGRVSQTIASLERQVGGQLFERTSRRVRLTGLGERFRAGAQQGYADLVRTLHDCQAAARGMTGRFRIAYQPTLGGAFITSIASALAVRHPEWEIVFNAIVLHRAFDLPALFQEAVADLALVWFPGGDGRAGSASNLTIGPVLARESRGVLVPEGHPLTRRSVVSLDDLRDYELLRFPEHVDDNVRGSWTPRFAPSGQSLRYTKEDLCQLAGRTEVLDEDVHVLVTQGRGLYLTVASLLERTPFPGLAVIPIRDLPPVVIVPVWLRSAETVATRAVAHAAALACSVANAG